MALKMAPKLSRGVPEPSHFKKMKVSSEIHVFSKSTSEVHGGGDRLGSYLTTSGFLEKMDDWFDLMSSRNVVTALSHFNMESMKRPSASSSSESCVLYHLAGYIEKRVISSSLCEECQCALVEKVTNLASESCFTRVKII